MMEASSFSWENGEEGGEGGPILNYKHRIFHDFIDNTVNIWIYYEENFPDYYPPLVPCLIKILQHAYTVCNASDNRCRQRYNKVVDILKQINGVSLN